MVVLIALHTQKDNAKQHGQPHERNGAAAVVVNQRMVGNGQGDTRGQQQSSVDGGEPKRAHGGEGLDDVGWRTGHTCGHARPHRLETGPQQGIVQTAGLGNRMRTAPPQRGKESPEKHDFREDEPAHAPAKGNINALAVLTAFALGNRVAEPLEQDHEQNDETQRQGVFTPVGIVHPLGRTQNDKKQSQGRHGRMAGRLRNKIMGRPPVCV